MSANPSSTGTQGARFARAVGEAGSGRDPRPADRLPRDRLCEQHSLAHRRASREQLWKRGRLPGGAIGNTIKPSTPVARPGYRMIWTKYRIFRQEYPQLPMDKVQYDYWASHYPSGPRIRSRRIGSRSRKFGN